MILADRISVLHQGRIEQVETPENIFYQPKTPFVAEFVEATNIFNVELVHLNGKTATFNLKNTELLRPLKLRQKSILSLPVKQSRLYACILKRLPLRIHPMVQTAFLPVLWRSFQREQY